MDDNAGLFFIPEKLSLEENIQNLDDKFIEELIAVMTEAIDLDRKCPCGKDPCGTLHFWVRMPENIEGIRDE